MTLQLHRPDGLGGLEPQTETPKDWRDQLESPRWNASPLKNPEMNPTSRMRSVLFWLGLGVATFLLIVIGYGSGFWKLSSGAEQVQPSPSPAAIVIEHRAG